MFRRNASAETGPQKTTPVTSNFEGFVSWAAGTQADAFELASLRFGRRLFLVMGKNVLPF
jgi:hypothetical protein